MKVYKRHVNESNQVAIVPKTGSNSARERKVSIDPKRGNKDLLGDERLAKLRLNIANSVVGCVQMEGDLPS